MKGRDCDKVSQLLSNINILAKYIIRFDWSKVRVSTFLSKVVEAPKPS